MGLVRKIERSGKRALMRAVGAFLRARPVSAGEVRERRFDRILVIRQHNQMGDMMLAIPALRAIRESQPGARIGVVSSTLNRGVLEGHPYVDRLFTYDKRSPASHFRLVRALRREAYDVVVLLHTVSFSFTSVALAVLSRARLRVGSTSRALGEALTGSYLNLTLPLPSQAELTGMNEAEHNLYPLAAIGWTTDDIAPLLVPREENSRWAESFAADCWRDGGARLLIHPGAGKAENIWPPERFAEVVARLADEAPVSPVVVEGPSDGPTVSAFLDASTVPARTLRGRSIADVAALQRLADLVLCNDTGVMHVSAAAGARTLAVFGPTDPGRWAPRCDNLHVVRSPQGDLGAVTAADVTAAARELLLSVPR